LRSQYKLKPLLKYQERFFYAPLLQTKKPPSLFTEGGFIVQMVSPSKGNNLTTSS